MEFEYKIFEKFKDAKTLWEKLEINADLTPFQSYYWMNSWYDTIGKEIKNLEVRIVFIDFNHNEKILLPLGITKHFFINKLSYLGSYQADYMVPIISKNFSINRKQFLNVWNKIVKKLGQIDFIDFNQQLRFINQTLNPFFNIYNPVMIGKATHTNLNNQWEETYNHIFSSKTRQTDRRKLKKIKLNGNYKFFVAKCTEEKNKIIHAMIKQKTKRYKKTNVWNMFSKSEYIEFYDSHKSKEKFSNFKMHFSALMVDNDYVATHFGIITKDTFLYLMPGQDEDTFSKYSPGRLLIIELMKWSEKNKLKIFDFTIGDEVYKHHWATSYTPTYKIVQINSLSGGVFFYISMILNKIKSLRILNGTIKKIYLSFIKKK